MVEVFEDAEDLGALFVGEEEGEGGGEVVLIFFDDWLWDVVVHAWYSCWTWV